MARHSEYNKRRKQMTNWFLAAKRSNNPRHWGLTLFDVNTRCYYETRIN